jgi:hypothetical protein
MYITEKIQKIALIFFFAFGTIYLVSYLMVVNNYILDTSILINKVFEIPFILTAAIYGFTSLKLSLSTSNKNNLITNIIFIALVVALFALLIYLNVFVPDRIV